MGYRAFPYYEWGWLFKLRAQSGNPCKGKSFTEATFMATKKKAKKKKH